MTETQLPLQCKKDNQTADKSCPKSTLLSMPPEILDWIVREIPYRHDLSSLSRTCKSLKNAAFPRLYANLVLKVPQSWSVLRNFEYLLASGGEGLQYTTSLKITTHVGRLSATDFREDRFAMQPEEPEPAILQIYFPGVSASIHLNALVRILLKRLPRQRITEFIWDHGCICDVTTIHDLLETQAPGLTTLSFDQINHDGVAFDRHKVGLQSLRLRSLEGNNLYWLWEMSSSQMALKHLTLGAEIDAIQSFYWPQRGSDNDYDIMLDRLMESFIDNANDDDDDDDEGGKFLLTLGSFELIGLNIDKLIRGPLSLLDFSELTSLSLEDCQDVEDFFTVVQNANNKQGVETQSLLRLRSFHLRHYSISQATNIRALLLAFLTSIPGLTNLSILLQANERPQDFRDRNFGNVLLTHGKSLRTLLWEERIGCRESYVERLNATFPSPEGLIEIAQSCNNLVELSIPIDWRIFSSMNVPWKHVRARTALQSLTQLRTLNIRNMPSFDPTVMNLPVDRAFKGFVDSAIAALIISGHVNDSMPLDTLALGAMTYRDVRNGLGLMNIHEKDLYEFLRPHIYAVDRRYQFEGKPQPLAILREIGTYEKTEAAGHCVEVLKPYWLG